MSESEDFEFDSEEEMETLRMLQRAVQSDENSLTASQATSSNQQWQAPQEDKKSAIYNIELSLALNKQQDEKLLQLEKNLDIRLIECRELLKKISGRKLTEVDRSESFRYINCGRPYFKDRENFAAPDNDDTLIMMKNHMYDFSNITSVPGWTIRDKTQLWNHIEKMTKVIKRKELVSSIAALKREAKKNKKFEETVVIDKKISKIKKELNKLAHKTLDKIALPIDMEYDWEQVTQYLDRRHNATEYQSLWKLYLHPSINKTNWSKAEHQLLQKVAHDHHLVDWESIAQEMGNNRTGYQCFVYFRTNMNNTFTGKKWSEEEVQYLSRLIEYYKEGTYIPWVKVAALMENRTKIQIYNKYTRLLEQRKGRFLIEEDAVILTCLDNFGPNLKKMLEHLPGRSLSQIRARYQTLNKNRVSTVWTVDEDRKLLQLLSNQDSINYAAVTKYFPGKDRINIRTRYCTLVKWMRRNPNADIAKAPRRGARRLGHGKPSENLNIAVATLTSRMITDANKKRTNRINAESTEDDIEDGIVAALINEKHCLERIAMHDMYDSVNLSILENDGNIYDSLNEGNLQKILLLLRAKLNKERFDKHHSHLNRCNLIKLNNQTCIVKVKSYSKQHKIKSIEIDASPDIWGNNTFKSIEYILPPHYATITGCRKLMSFVTVKQEIQEDETDDVPCSMNFNMLARRNVLLREQMDVLMERFNILFLWPLMLSNDGPNLQQMKAQLSANSIKEVPLSRRHVESDNTDTEVHETGEENMTIDMLSDAEANPKDDCLQGNNNVNNDII